jgi:hypothetical protein
MIQRCTNPKNKGFKDYGGRGIMVCDFWRGKHGYDHFLSEMGHGKKGWTIERIDNDKGYSVWNCCWATQAHQARNKRNNVILTVRGKTACLTDLCVHFRVKPKTITRRLKEGLSPEQAFFPVLSLKVKFIPERKIIRRKRLQRPQPWWNAFKIDRNGVEQRVLV